MKEFVITISCDDQVGIVAGLTTEISAQRWNITDSAQFWEQTSNQFFMRIAFAAKDNVERIDVERTLTPVVNRFGMSIKIHDLSEKQRIVIMVSKFDHALRHLLYQVQVGWLNAEIVAIVSNHEDAQAIAENADIPFYHMPINKQNKAEQEAQFLNLLYELGTDVVVLARYMQILSHDLCNRLYGKVINIHHSFLPSFKGAKPYHQAHARGVKIIGATAHYVTTDLDEGPIIEQETIRVKHSHTAEDLLAHGRDIEARVLSRAVKLHVEGRVLISGHTTIVLE
ncbi:MAG: formyltetrahydrofolate deformylase [Alphaproteobacteria bacterium]|nr:formyltetrahydrofolate deformylase [Alphaproteobacteria bacterium]